MKMHATLEQLIHIPYSNQNIDLSLNRIYQLAKLYLFNPSSGMVSCPLAMTDGAAFVLNQIRLQNPAQFTHTLQTAFKNLTTNDVGQSWTSG